ncbi:hypothetical protein [uncultured Amnibacterium sp.]|uniref:hypothetical protein n=1 Tax=uncultured Amnibacterium sp. TaxID=1631851 RepID=UPI0035CA18E7
MPGGLGGGAIIAFAAVLWLVYLTPSWVRRRQYLNTERTAVRLQQTLRILAETADVPDEVRAEVSARSVAEQHRALRAAAHRAEAVARPREAAAERTLARRPTAPREPRQRADAVSAITGARLRRTRAIGGVVLLLAVGVAGYGGWLAVTGGGVVLLVVGVVVAFGAIALLQRAATVAAAQRAVTAVDHAVPMQQAPQSFTDWQRTEQARPTWTPVPIPRPLYLERTSAAAEPDVSAAAETLRVAAKQADDALRRAHAAAEVVAIDATTAERRSTRPPVGPGDSEPVLSDLDAVLRRRRAG